jgi:hypothetical protein
MLRYFWWVLISLTGFLANAQVVQPGRFEIMLEPYDNYFTTISADEEGIIMYRETKERNAEGHIGWQVIMLDTALQEKWRELFYIDQEYFINGYDYHQGKLYLLFNNGPYANDEYMLFEIDLRSRTTQSFNIQKNFAMALTEYEMVGDAAILGGYVNYRPTVILYKLKEKRLLVLPGFYLDRSELIQVEVDDERGIFRVLTTVRTFDKRNTIAIKTFDASGELLVNSMLKPEQGLNLLYGRATSFIGNEAYIAGTYSQNRSANRGAESYSRGIFIARIDDLGEQVINYYNYADLENFFSYMKVKRQERVKRRIERRRIKGKKIRFNYRLLVHDVIPRKDHYIMLGEAYYPTYSNRYDAFGGFSSVNNPYLYASSFSGYRYTHAVVLGFNEKGKLLWDNSFEINDVVSYKLEKFVNVDIDQDKLVLLYLYENVIRTKLIQGQEVLEGKSFNDIRLKFEDDVVNNSDDEVGGLNTWYDDYFYAFGVQKIKNLRDTGVSLNREVFYVNKIIYK